MNVAGQAVALVFWLVLAVVVIREHHSQVMRDRADARNLARARAARRAMGRASGQ